MLMDIREDLQFGSEDSWQYKKYPPTFKGCEPMIQDDVPVECPQV